VRAIGSDDEGTPHTPLATSVGEDDLNASRVLRQRLKARPTLHDDSAHQQLIVQQCFGAPLLHVLKWRIWRIDRVKLSTHDFATVARKESNHMNLSCIRGDAIRNAERRE
jgi:hypothetical protein